MIQATLSNQIRTGIPFNIPTLCGKEMAYMARAISEQKFSGDGVYTARCHQWLEREMGCSKVLLTTSCTHALEMASLLIDIKPGDEVIMPSFTFVSTANPFVLRGAKIKFVDIRPDTMNIDENLIEDAITSKTKAIVPVHYAGIACDMDRIMQIANNHGLWVIEDAAQAIRSTYNGKALGTIGHLGCISFHDTKNIHCGEGGALIVNDPGMKKKAEIIREKGTNRAAFFRGEIDKYTWVGPGSSYLPSELNAAFLLAQLEDSESIISQRKSVWELYYQQLSPLGYKNLLELPEIPSGCKGNAHIFYIKLADAEHRQEIIDSLKGDGIHTVFHYVPLHSSTAGQAYGNFVNQDRYTTWESERLLRLPIYTAIVESEVMRVCERITQLVDKKIMIAV
uniref:dTDP-4-amino-4,6-dideoxygalactose transaminase n=1 Tax=Roseihalotalea indica TaxID=2867963 RepID=A0AA49GNH2_9BACT|nr:dTDP-4-amino-4,6-dideoxygalactose transaminase [Tunicatimonas sp. TK19036]